jgi:pimeloyl-ACP methyl ester carboxylesterase
MPWRESPEQLARARDEQPVVVPSALGSLFGILTPPARTGPAGSPAVSGPCVVLFTRPRSHRDRMFVELARSLAARGTATFRFDYHGTGDSGGASGYLDPNAPYREDAVTVLRHLRRHHGQHRFVLVGSCFDARTALAAFMDEADSIAGLAFLAAPCMALDTQVEAHADHTGWRHLGRSLGNPGNWRGLAEPARWRHMAKVLTRVTRRSLGAEGGELPLAPSFVEHFEALVRSRARALFLYGLEDQEYDTFQVAERTLIARLAPAARARFDIVRWPGHVHGFLEVARQRETLAALLDWIGTLPAPGGDAGP